MNISMLNNILQSSKSKRLVKLAILSLPLVLLYTSCANVTYPVSIKASRISSELLPPVIGAHYQIELNAETEWEMECPNGQFIGECNTIYEWVVDGVHYAPARGDTTACICLSSWEGDQIIKVGEHRVECFATLHFDGMVDNAPVKFSSNKFLVGEYTVVVFTFESIEDDDDEDDE